MRERARQVVVVVVALVFTAIAVGNVIAPAKMAEGIGLAATSTDGLNELRAVYVGLWLATAAIFALAVRRPALHVVCILLVGGQVVGRCLSLVIDGMPSEKLWPMFAVETIGVIALIALRPRRS